MNTLAQHIVNEDSNDQAFRSIKFGFCKAISELGLSPKQAEEFLQKQGEDSIWDMLKNYTGALAITGAGIGIGTAALRHKIKNTARRSESPEMRMTDAKIKAYKKMIADLQQENRFQGQPDPQQIGSV